MTDNNNLHQFLEQMKKNTESLGTIFDPQPSAIKGNIHAVSDPDEMVIGYINATTAQEQRIFISEPQLVNRGFNIYNFCSDFEIINNRDSLKPYIPGYWPYVLDVSRLRAPLYVYFFSTPECVDCRLRGGVNVKPNFW